MRSVLFVLGVLGIALSTQVSSGQPAGAELTTVAAEMTIVVQPKRVEITGAISSAANEKMLRETAARVFPGRTTVADLQQRIGLPPGWALVTDLTLQSLAETRSATATISPYQVSVRGFSEEGGGWKSAAERSQAYLPEGWVMNHQVEEIMSDGSMNRQCVEVFRTALRGRKIEFQRDSAEIGTATMPVLDELIQIAVDCPASRIRITGHTDDTGSATDNLSLSRQRADAVAAYLVAGGIAIQRIKSEGVGSAQPLVAGNTAQARKLNRRIEMELQFP